MKYLRPLLPLAALTVLAAHCAVDRAPAGLRATPPGTGPEVVFDLERQPLPEIPQPNDVATFPDPTSRTGRRLNVSVLAPTAMEQAARVGFGEMEGWGTFAPITVAFQREPTSDPSQAAIDLADVAKRMQHDGHDMSDDPIYVVNLTTGLPVMLDMGDGNFPATPRDLDAYWPNDPKINEQNILFESVEEGPSLLQSQYSSDKDLDFDGVVDHPNTMDPFPAIASGWIHGVDDLLTWYERESDTLIARPLLPLDEKTEYAVILTDRLHGPDGQPVRSPFEYVNHPEQTADLAKVQTVLSDPARTSYFGDLAGTGASHISFAWTFTTEPVYEDLRLLRDGLYGRGPFASLAAQFPVKATALRAAGLATDPSDEDPSNSTNPICVPAFQRPFAVYVPAATETLNLIVEVVLKKEFTLTASQQLILEQSLQNVDHFVIGEFTSPYFLGVDPAHENPDEWFHINYKTGEARVTSDTVPFFLAVPKATPGKTQPFPTVVWSHGTALFSEEAIIRAGYLAGQGLATLAIDMPGHGLYLNDSTQELAQVALSGSCYVEWINALEASRAHDLNGDGVPDSGGYLWTSHIFHSRDNIRQSVIDQMQAVRLIRSFDGGNRSDQDFNGDGKPDLAGDFDGDGTPDIGEGAPIYTSGNSYGGIVAMIHGAVDPYVVASAPISGGGGLSDIAAHSSLVPTPVLEQIFSPLVIAVPASSRDSTAALPSSCGPSQVSLRFEVNDLLNSRELEIACLDPGEIGPNKTVAFKNGRNGEVRCARTDANGLLRDPRPGERRRLDPDPDHRRARRGRLVQDVQPEAGGERQRGAADHDVGAGRADVHADVRREHLPHERVPAVPRDVLPGGLAARGPPGRARLRATDARHATPLHADAGGARSFGSDQLRAVLHDEAHPRDRRAAAPAARDPRLEHGGRPLRAGRHRDGVRARGEGGAVPPSVGASDDAGVRRLRDAGSHVPEPSAGRHRTTSSSRTT